MLFVLFLAALITADAAKVPKLFQQSQLCAQSKAAGQSFATCSYSADGLTFLCDLFPWDAAWTACTSLGMRLAVLTSGDVLPAYDVVSECIAGAPAAWVASYNGLAGSPCMYLTANGTVVESNGLDCTAMLPAVCQPLDPRTVTVPSTTISSASSVTLTSTQQVCPSNGCNCSINCRRQNCNTCTGHLYTDSNGAVDRWPSCCDEQGCDPLCPTSLNGLFIIQSGGSVPFSQADRECRKYGLTLADLTSGLLPTFANLTDRCIGDNPSVWVRSFNGVGDGEECVYAYNTADPVNHLEYQPVGFGLVGSACAAAHVQSILCQEGPAADLGYGPFIGVGSTTTISSGIAATLTQTVTTTTVVVTYYP